MTNGQTQSQFVTGFAVPSQGSNAIQSEEDGEEEKKFEASLQPAGMINRGLESGFGANGNDPLTAGHVEVESQVEVQLTGAAANVTYTVQFCRFAVGTSGCLSVGSVSTDAMGNAQAEVGFAAMGTFDGVFILTRMQNGQMLNEFVTAFRIL